MTTFPHDEEMNFNLFPALITRGQQEVAFYFVPSLQSKIFIQSGKSPENSRGIETADGFDMCIPLFKKTFEEP